MNKIYFTVMLVFFISFLLFNNLSKVAEKVEKEKISSVLSMEDNKLFDEILQSKFTYKYADEFVPKIENNGKSDDVHLAGFNEEE